MSAPLSLADRIVDRRVTLAILGQGYVGLTLAASATAAGFPTVGIDVDLERVRSLAAGDMVVPGVDEQLFREGFRSGRLSFASEPSPIGEADLVFICVPTPLRDHAPDLSFVEKATRDVSEHLHPGVLVVLESTTFPGTTEQLVRPILEAGSGLQADADFLLAYSPERIDPGNNEYGMRNIPRVVGGLTVEATEASVAFYTQLVDKVVAVSCPRAAETAKLLENTFRHINIALVNELAMVCHELGIDTWEVIEAAATKPFGFMPFFPGPGVGGHCIPLDPTYLMWQARREVGMRFGVLEQAQDVNEGMPKYVAGRVAEILNERGSPVNGAKILVLGVAYKPDVGDIRESPALQAMQALYTKGAEVRFHDPHVDEVPLNGGVARCVDDLDMALSEADVTVLLTPHTDYDLDLIAKRSAVVFDTRNAYGGSRPSNVVAL
jgi:nucleotide sugar dehydrogenase